MSSLANEQFCYLTTPEEYGLQRYEGGNTLYGPDSQPFVAACAAPPGRRPRPGRPGRRAAAAAALRLPGPPVPGPPHRIDARRATALGAPDFHDPTGTEDGYWELRWLGPAPGDLAWHEPLVRVEAATGDGGWTGSPTTRVTTSVWSHLGAGPRREASTATPRAGSPATPARRQPHRFVLEWPDHRPETASDPFA